MVPFLYLWFVGFCRSYSYYPTPPSVKGDIIWMTNRLTMRPSFLPAQPFSTFLFSNLLTKHGLHHTLAFGHYSIQQILERDPERRARTNPDSWSGRVLPSPAQLLGSLWSIHPFLGNLRVVHSNQLGGHEPRFCLELSNPRGRLLIWLYMLAIIKPVIGTSSFFEQFVVLLQNVMFFLLDAR